MERCLVCTIGLTRTRSAGAATTRAPRRTGSQPAHGAAAYASWMTGPVPHDRVALLVNGSSRRGADAYGRTLRGLRSAGLAVMRSVLLEDPAQLPAEVAAAVGATCRLLVVGGGDGTVGAVAGLLADLPPEVRPVLGVVPLGTANDFARTLDLQPGVVAALTALATGKVVDVDLGRANGAPFLNVASLGLSVGATHALHPGLKRRLGPIAYPVATLQAYRRHEPFDIRLEFPDGDREPLELTGLLQVAVGNGRHYGGGNTVAPDAGIDDASLDVYAVRAGRIREHLSLARLLRSGNLVHHDHVQHVVTPAVRLTSDRPLPVNLDGEISAASPVEFRVQRNAVEVVVPQHITHLSHEGPPTPAEPATPDRGAEPVEVPGQT
ncbi:lipid kinase [Microlunatus capsulatus]